MKSQLPESARRVQSFLDSQGIDSSGDRIAGKHTHGGRSSAGWSACGVAHIAKSLVFRATRTGRSILVIASGANRVDEAAIARLISEPIEKASPEFVRDKTGYAIGGVPPVAHIHEPVVFIDQDLAGLFGNLGGGRNAANGFPDDAEGARRADRRGGNQDRRKKKLLRIHI